MSVLDAPIKNARLGPWPPAPRPRLASARAAVALTSVADAETVIEDHCAAVNARRAQRETRRTMRGPQPRCSACHKFTTTADAECVSCGYKPGRGFRG